MLLSTKVTDGILTMRPFHPDDTQGLFTAVHESLSELKPWMSWAYDSYSQHEAADFIAITRARWEENNLFAFVITDAKEGTILGGCSISHIHPIYYLCNIGYWVRTSYRGKGFAGQAAKLAARFAFEKIGLIRAEIVITVGNLASLRVAEKIGAHYEGLLFNRMVVGKSIYDAHMYSLLPSDFGLVAHL